MLREPNMISDFEFRISNFKYQILNCEFGRVARSDSQCAIFGRG